MNTSLTPSTPLIPDDLDTPANIAKMLGTSAASVRRWVKTGRLIGYRLGGQLRVSRSDARSMLVRAEPVAGGILTKAEAAMKDVHVDAVLRKVGIRR